MASDQASSAGAAERYASALFELARDSNALDAASKDLAAFAGMVGDSDDLSRLLFSPAFGADEKLKGALAVAEKAGLGELVRNFIGVLGANRRLGALPAVAAEFERLLAAHRGVVRADVVTPTALSDAQRDTLAATLKTVAGRDVEIEASVDPALLGGLVVKLGSRMFDSSLKTKLEGLKSAMKGA